MSDEGLIGATKFISSGMQHVQIAQYGNDTGMHAEFYSEPEYQEFESIGGELITGTIKSPTVQLVTGKGRPVYRDKVYITITRPGAKSDVQREVPMNADGTPVPGNGSYPSFPERFPRQWQQFMNKQEQTHSGTPLEMWPVLKKSQVLELKGAKIHTIEQLGSLPDSTLQNIGILEVRILRDKAKSYMESADNSASLMAAQHTIEQQRIDIESLKAQFAELAAERTEQKRGPGRPRKEETNDV